MRDLGTLADTATREHLVCLGGPLAVVDGSQEELPRHALLGDTLVLLNQLSFPAPAGVREHRTSVTAPSNACPPGTRLAWHNHPVVASLTYLRSIRLPAQDAADACFFSKTDLEHGLWREGQILGEVVQVNSRVFCWWFSAQLARVPPLNWVSVVMPIVGQFRTDWGAKASERP
jgi:hypothetical protein